MAFLDKVSDVFDQGVDAAKDLGEIGVAKGKILINDQKIKDVYKEIGELVYKAGGVIPEEGIQSYIEKIQELEAENVVQEMIIKETKNKE